MDFADLQTATRDLLGVPTGDGLVTVTRLKSWINRACQILSTEHDWPWLDQVDVNTELVSGISDYPLPDDWRETRAVTVNGSLARLISVQQGDAWFEQDDAATLWQYVISQGNIVFYPTPGGGETLIHQYVCDEPELVNDEDEPLMPDRWRYAIALKAATYASFNTDDPAGAATFNAEVTMYLKKMQRATSRSQGPRRIRVRPGGGL